MIDVKLKNIRNRLKLYGFLLTFKKQNYYLKSNLFIKEKLMLTFD